MCKRILSAALVGLLINLVCYTPVAANFRDEAAKSAVKVKAAVAKLGTGPDARIEITLRDKTKLKGYVSEANEERFIVVDGKTGAATQITYPQVKQVKGRNKLLTRDKLGYLGYVALFALITVNYIGYARK